MFGAQNLCEMINNHPLLGKPSGLCVKDVRDKKRQQTPEIVVSRNLPTLKLPLHQAEHLLDDLGIALECLPRGVHLHGSIQSLHPEGAATEKKGKTMFNSIV